MTSLESRHQKRPYLIERHSSGKGYVVTRPGTGSTVKISERLIATTSARLALGPVQYRSVSSTVAVARGVMAVLAETLAIVHDDVERPYAIT